MVFHKIAGQLINGGDGSLLVVAGIISFEADEEPFKEAWLDWSKEMVAVNDSMVFLSLASLAAASSRTRRNVTGDAPISPIHRTILVGIPEVGINGGGGALGSPEEGVRSFRLAV